MISNSGHDERGKYSGGQAGDQTGTEWAVIPWYNRPWNLIARHPDAAVQVTIAELAKEAAENNNIGYDQSQRGTFWTALAKSGYRPKNIKVKCEGDCSAGVLAICKATGYLVGDSKLKAINQNGTTYTMRQILTQAGFKVYTDLKYLTSDKYLMPGDILLNEKHHTAINLTRGALVPADGQASGSSAKTQSDGCSDQNQALQTAKHYSKSLSGTYQVVTSGSDLNIRVKSGTAKDCTIVGSLKNGAKISFWGYYNLVGSVKWFLVQSGNVKGFVSSQWLKKV